MKWIVMFWAAAIAVSVGVSSCTEETVEEAGALGKEATTGERNKAVNDTFADITILNAKVGSAVTYEQNQRVELGPVTKTGSVEHIVTSVKDYGDTVGFVMTETITQYDAAGHETDKKTSETPPLVIEKNPPQAAAQVMSMSSAFSLLKTAALQALATECDGVDEEDSNGVVYDCIRYFNLRTRYMRLPPPDDVKKSTGCGGIPDCLMTIRYITYDEVKWRGSQSVLKTRHEAEVAPEVADIMYIPYGNSWEYIPPVLSYCQRGMRTVSGNKYMVSFCTVLRDFHTPE